MPARRSRRVFWWLFVVTGVPIAVLSVLAAWVLRQERIADRERQREALSLAADRLALELDRHLEDRVATLSPGTGIVLTADGLRAPAAQPILYQPLVDSVPPLPSARLATAEALEHRTGDLTAAAAAYRLVAAASRDSERAAALVGLGRTLRRLGRQAEALEAYTALESLGATPVDGQPAALVAHLARGRTLAFAGGAPLMGVATALARALNQGGWRIDRAMFESYVQDIRTWHPSAPAPPAVAVARTEAAIQLWHASRAGTLPPRGRMVVDAAGTPVVGLWSTLDATPVAVIATGEDLGAFVKRVADAQRIAAVGLTSDGRRLFGVASSHAVSVMPSDARLPFNLSVTSMDAPDGGPTRPLLLAGLGAAFALLLFGAYTTYRTTTRELTLARQQTDFVSAVSHEFRTPLTSMRHLTDVLLTRHQIDDERRVHYYTLLSAETERLHRMVEGLLSFGRLEAGAYAWRLEAADVTTVVRSVVDEFRTDGLGHSRDVTVDATAPLQVVIDVEAFSRALSNLLENAAKYSSPDSPIVVAVTASDSRVHVAVTDRGIGIPAEEQRRVFERFVRGTDASQGRIAGVGIGLALVKAIVEGHGGSVAVESRVGVGSTFTLTMPIAARSAAKSSPQSAAGPELRHES